MGDPQSQVLILTLLPLALNLWLSIPSLKEGSSPLQVGVRSAQALGKAGQGSQKKKRPIVGGSQKVAYRLLLAQHEVGVQH